MPQEIPNIRHLRVFMEVANCHSVSGAAERAHLSQPAVTQAIAKLEIKAGDTVLDLGAGTGDLAFEAIRRHPEAFVVASDFTIEMVLVGKQRPDGDNVAWVIADAMKDRKAVIACSGSSCAGGG